MGLHCVSPYVEGRAANSIKPTLHCAGTFIVLSPTNLLSLQMFVCVQTSIICLVCHLLFYVGLLCLCVVPCPFACVCTGVGALQSSSWLKASK